MKHDMKNEIKQEYDHTPQRYLPSGVATSGSSTGNSVTISHMTIEGMLSQEHQHSQLQHSHAVASHLAGGGATELHGSDSGLHRGLSGYEASRYGGVGLSSASGVNEKPTSLPYGQSVLSVAASQTIFSDPAPPKAVPVMDSVGEQTIYETTSGPDGQKYYMLPDRRLPSYAGSYAAKEDSEVTYLSATESGQTYIDTADTKLAPSAVPLGYAMRSTSDLEHPAQTTYLVDHDDPRLYQKYETLGSATSSTIPAYNPAAYTQQLENPTPERSSYESPSMYIRSTASTEDVYEEHARSRPHSPQNHKPEIIRSAADVSS